MSLLVVVRNYGFRVSMSFVCSGKLWLVCLLFVMWGLLCIVWLMLWLLKLVLIE